MLVQLTNPKDRLFNHMDKNPNIPNDYFPLSNKISVAYTYQISSNLANDLKKEYLEQEVFRMLTRTKKKKEMRPRVKLMYTVEESVTLEINDLNAQ
jgi:sensor histidine kinase YesM